MKPILGAAVGAFVGGLVFRHWGAALGGGLGAWAGLKMGG